DEAEAKAGVMMESERELETEDAGLTLEEKIRRMDQAFSRSLSKFRESKNQFQMEVSGAQGDVAAENLPAGPSSVASGDLAGDEEPMQQPDGPQDSVSAPSDGLSVLANGKLPDDILPSDNDSILEAQIRQAAINETDPELQKKLWNEYRKYKGLPPV
ncbi:MAG: hypothetical protein OSB67_08040, partial [Alphaproteobacteria bacterium]|nr:hypothetical protein [Alphaproteobacteria bacterium]